MYFQYTHIKILLHALLRSPCRVLRPARHTPARHTRKGSRQDRARMLLRGHTWVSRRSHGSALALDSRVLHDHTDIRCWVGIYIFAARKLLQKQGLKTIGANIFWHAKDSAGETISAVRLGLVTQLLRLMQAHIDLILFASCVFTIYSYRHTAASLLRSPCRALRPARHTERFAKRSCTNAAARAHMSVSPFTRICSCAK